MDKFSFLNSAHTSFFAEMYDQYLESPDSLEPSWKAFFQGYDFANSDFNKENTSLSVNILMILDFINLNGCFKGL